MKNKVVKLFGSSVLAAMVAAACGQMKSSSSMNSSQGHSMHGSMMRSSDSKWTASDLRISLNAQLGEHVLIAAVATSHALGGRQPAFEGAVGGLDSNSIDITKAIGAVYGADAEKRSCPCGANISASSSITPWAWRAKDKAKQDKAVTDLVNYASDFGAFLSAANPNLAEKHRRRSGQNSCGDFERCRRCPGDERLAEAYSSDSLGVSPYADDRRSAGWSDRETVSFPLRRFSGCAGIHSAFDAQPSAARACDSRRHGHWALPSAAAPPSSMPPPTQWTATPSTSPKRSARFMARMRKSLSAFVAQAYRLRRRLHHRSGDQRQGQAGQSG